MQQKRGKNFTELEKVLILELIKEHEEVIESKQTDNFIADARFEAWKTVCSKFNRIFSGAVPFRDVAQLKQFYKNLKRVTKGNNQYYWDMSSSGCLYYKKLTDTAVRLVAASENAAPDDSILEDPLSVYEVHDVSNCASSCFYAGRVKSPKKAVYQFSDDSFRFIDVASIDVMNRKMELSDDEHYKEKRNNSVRGNMRRESEFYHELEDLFEEDYDRSFVNYNDFKFGKHYLRYSMPLTERLNTTNNKSQTAPKTSTPNIVPKQEYGTQSQSTQPSTPQPNDDDKDPDEVCLRWNSHHSNMKSSFPTLLEKEQYVDVTLCSEGQTIRCHRLILSSCSSYFDEILSGITPLQHPVIFLKGTPFWILKSLIDFMYVGEVHIEQAKLQEILEVAEILKIKGLTGKAPASNSNNAASTAPKDDVAKAQEQPSTTQSQTPAKQPQRSVPPLRLAVTKEQAASMQTVDPLSLLKPSFYEESPPVRRQPIPIKPKFHHQSLAEFSAKQKEWLSKKIAPKKKFKRRSSEHDPSPPPVILRKGTKSRPIVKAPKYYHMEYEEKKDDKQVKSEDGEEGEQSPDVPESTNSSLLILAIPPLQAPTPTEPTFDITNVKNEPIDMDIEENYVDDYDNSPSPPTIRITEPRTVTTDETNAFLMSPNSPDHLTNEKDPEQNGRESPVEKDDDDDDDGPPVLEPEPEPEEENRKEKSPDKDDKDAND